MTAIKIDEKDTGSLLLVPGRSLRALLIVWRYFWASSEL